MQFHAVICILKYKALSDWQYFLVFQTMEKQISWTVAAISEFAKAKKLTIKQAFNYLNLFKGIEFLQKHYGAEHLLSFDDTVEDLIAICSQNESIVKFDFIENKTERLNISIRRGDGAVNMNPKQQYLAECIVSEMALWLIQDRSLSLSEALNVIYNSQTFEKLQNPQTSLYQESSAYDYELLSSEIRNGKFIQEEI